MQLKPRLFLLAVLFLFVLPLHAQDLGTSFTGRVVGVKDGDTIEVMRADKAVTVRLHGVDAPETGQAYGTRARQLTAGVAFADTVSVEVIDTDRYGRLVGTVRLSNGRNLNHLLVSTGMAWWYRQYAPKDRVLEQLEVAAREDSRGLWADPNPTPPWEWRRRSGGSGNQPVDDKDCSDFTTQAEAQRFFVSQGGPEQDGHRLDADGDGLACESLPATRRPAVRRSRSCCKICRKGKACGDSCIARNKTCRKGPGCACNGG